MIDIAQSHHALPQIKAERETTGLVIYRASRLEALLDPFRDLLAATWPEDPLTPQTVIAAHPGMKQWLTGALARRMGEAGIVANLDVVLPSTWIDRLAQSRLGAQAVSLPRWQRAHLRWNLHEWLGDVASVPGLDDPRIRRFLDPSLSAAERSRRRFQLADRLARLYSQYLVYRADWLDAWASGITHFATRNTRDRQLIATEAQLLAPLWRQAVADIGTYRSQVVADLIGTLNASSQGAASLPALHVFGASHLAPAELAMLRAYAKQALVALYLPDPCRDYWGVLGEGDAASWRAQEEVLIDEADGGDWWRSQGHELLARWGRLGQHFFAALADGDVREDIRHWRDTDDASPTNRLQRIQQSIRQLDEGLITPSADVAAEMRDASLRVHIAHTPQRELEILRDAMLDANEHGITPGEMLVMAPDIRRYLPLIPALFGTPGDAREPLPYHLADVPMSRAHPLFAAFERWLALPASRVGVDDILDLMSMPEVARRFGLDAGGLEALNTLLEESRVAWSLDPTHRAGFGVPAIAENGFAWALDRMLAGYLMSDTAAEADVALRLPDDTELLPLSNILGDHADAVGALDALLQQVQRLTSHADVVMPASQWAQFFREISESVLRIDRSDHDAREAWDALQRLIASLADETTGAGVDPELHFVVVVERLRDALAAVPERQPFLLGGATFSGMVPQRAIPFRFIAVLGLDDGVFPRNADHGGLDLMAKLRRLGDRDQRFDDRYLFLETVMSARDRLHLSYIGEGVRDGQARNPASPLAELAAVLSRADAAASEDMKKAVPWRVKHPLQPFDARYFDDGKDSDPRLFSYAARHAGMRATAHAPRIVEATRVESQLESHTTDTVLLDVFKSYWRDPAKDLLRRRMDISLDALEDTQLSAEEPLDARLSRFDSVARRLLFEGALGDADWWPEQAPDWLRLDGRLPAGQPGRDAWQHERELTRVVANALREQGAVDAASAERESLEIELSLPPGTGAERLLGRIDNLFPSPRGGLQLLNIALPRYDAKKDKWQDVELDFGKRVPAFIDWLAARLTLPVDLPLRCTFSTQTPDAWAAGLELADAAFRDGDLSRTELEQRLARLVTWWRSAGRHPLRYFPRTSWAAWQAVQEGDVDVASVVRKTWASSDYKTGERDFAPGYAAMLAGDDVFAIGSPALGELQEFARDLAATLHVGFGAGQ